LAATYCSNSDIKRAFLFSCLSGLRWVDVKSLKHGDIDRNQGHIIFTQSKTRHSSVKSQVIIPLTPTLVKLIGEPLKPADFIYKLPSFSGAMGVLKFWANTAKLNKNITWHSARHSFAVNLLGDAKADIKTVADLLGHSGLKHTEKYLHVVDERKKTAMNNLLGLQF
jgi:integrase